MSEMRIEVAIAVLMERIVKETYADRKPSAIQPLQWSILRYLSNAIDSPKNLTSIAKYVGATNASVGRAVKSLERKELVLWGSDPISGQSALLTITVSGRIALDEDPMLDTARKISALSDNKRENLAEALQQLALMD